MKLKVASLSGPISAGTSVASTRRELINSNSIITDFREQLPGQSTMDCLIQEHNYELVSGEDGSLHVTWRSGNFFARQIPWLGML